MKADKIVGLVLFAVGLLLLYFGYRATETVTEQVHETVTGRYTETTMWYLIAGTACGVGGVVLVFMDVGPGE